MPETKIVDREPTKAMCESLEALIAIRVPADNINYTRRAAFVLCVEAWRVMFDAASALHREGGE